jgi:hypothetical protein
MLDLSKPDGTGALTIKTVSIERDGTTYHFEGPVEGYGSAFCSAKLTPYDADETRGTVAGEARVLGDDGSLVAAPVYGTFRREGTVAQVYIVDSCSNGDQNFVSWRMDLASREVAVSYWSLVPSA